LLEDDVPPELMLWDDEEDNARGGLKGGIGSGAMMGDDAHHGTFERDCRNPTNAKHGGLDKNGNRVRMRLATTVYIGEFI